MSMDHDALIQPFPGWRPAAALAPRVAAPPYDVLSSDEARRLAAGNPHSFLHISKAEIDLEPGISVFDPRVYDRAGENYARFCQEGILRQDPRPCLYLHQLELEGRSQVGVVAAVSVAAYLEGRIKRHEFTRPDKEDDRTHFADRIGAHSGPAFLVHRRNAEIEALVEAGMAHAPAYAFTGPGGVRHAFWVIDDPRLIQGLCLAFQGLDGVYIADGHHRSAAAGRICQERRQALGDRCTGAEPWNRFLAVLFPDHQVRILDYNRVVRDLNGLSIEDFLAQVGQAFTITPTAQPVRPGHPREFGLFLDHRWFQLILKPGRGEGSDPVARLDVSLLNDHLLTPILGITDFRRDSRIDFVGGARGIEGLMARVISGEMAAAFSLHPTSLADLMAVADSGQVMPPKSTWFEPKLLDGLVVQEI